MARKYLKCPDCGRKGVYKRFDNGPDDVWKCRYEFLGCEFFAYDNGNAAHDVENRRRLGIT